MPIAVNKIINNLTTPVIRLKQQKFGQGFMGAISSIKDEFIHKTPQTADEIKDYLDKKISSIFDKTEEALNEECERNGFVFYKADDRDSKLKSNKEAKEKILTHIRWGYNKGNERLKDELPLYEKILNTPEFFEQKLRFSDYSEPYSREKEYNLYETTGQHLLYSIAYHTETPEKLKLLDKFIDTKPDNFDDIKLFQNVLRQRNLFPQKTNLLEKIISDPSLKEQKTFYISYNKPVYSIGLETLAEMKTPEQVKLLEQIIDNKDKHRLFGVFVGRAIKKMNKEQTEMFSQLIENKDYLDRIHSSKVLLESFADFDDKQSMDIFKKYLTTTNDMYKTKVSSEIAPFSVEYNDMHSMLSICHKDENPHALKVLNRFLDDKKLYENSLLLNDFGCLLDVSKIKEGAKLVNKIFDNEKLCNNREFLRKFSYIHSCEKENKIQKMRNLYTKYTGQYV